MRTLFTVRLILRNLSPDDAEDYFELTANTNVAAGAGWKPASSRDEITPLIHRLIEKDILWAVECKQNKKLIGAIALSDDPFRSNKTGGRSLTYSLGEAYWGQGYATEAVNAVLHHAFNDKKLEYVSCSHFPSNLRSKRVIEKCGFVCEGTLRQAWRLWNGQVCDAVCYSILREEFYHDIPLLQQ